MESDRRCSEVCSGNLLFKAKSARGAMPARLNIVRWLHHIGNAPVLGSLEQ